jgi:urocanate hydratase
VKNAYDIGDSFTEYIAPKLAEGFARVYCVAQSGQPADIRRIDALALEIFPHNDALARWITLVQKRVRFQGPPARGYWLSRQQQAALRAGIGELAARGELQGGITVGVHPSDSAA